MSAVERRNSVVVDHTDEEDEEGQDQDNDNASHEKTHIHIMFDASPVVQGGERSGWHYNPPRLAHRVQLLTVTGARGPARV